ncbi:MAG: endonuclease III [Cyanobacteriota bacterium]
MNIDIDKIMQILDNTYEANNLISSMEEADDPYKLLISCLLSLRTKDETTYPAAKRLFKLAGTPQDMIKLNPKIIEETIYPVGFYHNKTQTILTISKLLIEQYDGKVPADMDKLLEFKGVGRKTANLVLARGFKIPAICVDTHVHRISNRLGYVKTKNPEETEMTLRKNLPSKWWFTINTVLVRHGQETCKPTAARCFECPVEKYCLKVDVKMAKYTKPKIK